MRRKIGFFLIPVLMAGAAGLNAQGRGLFDHGFRLKR
jgi:hypothetical protein